MPSKVDFVTSKWHARRATVGAAGPHGRRGCWGCRIGVWAAWQVPHWDDRTGDWSHHIAVSHMFPICFPNMVGILMTSTEVAYEWHIDGMSCFIHWGGALSVGGCRFSWEQFAWHRWLGRGHWGMLLSDDIPSGNQEWQWEIPHKWRFEWENHL